MSDEGGGGIQILVVRPLKKNSLCVFPYLSFVFSNPTLLCLETIIKSHMKQNANRLVCFGVNKYKIYFSH